MLGVCHVCAELNNNLDALQGSLGPQLPVDRAGRLGSRHLLLRTLSRGRRDRVPDRLADPAQPLRRWPSQHPRGRGHRPHAGRADRALQALIAFVVSAVLTGLLGVIYAHSLGYITTDSVYRDRHQPQPDRLLAAGRPRARCSARSSAPSCWCSSRRSCSPGCSTSTCSLTGLLLVVLVLAAPGAACWAS